MNKYVLLIVFVLIPLLLITIFFNYKQEEVANDSADITVNLMGKESTAPEVNPLTNKTEPININKVFDGVFETNNTEDEWVLVATGDVMLGRSVNTRTLKYNDYTWAFKNIKDLLSDADVSFINLENPLIENCPSRDDGMLFCGGLKHVEGLNYAGIDLASLSNNHSLNHGIKGVEETVKILNENNIKPIGVNNPDYIDVKGKKIAILGFNEIECYTGIECNEDKNIIEDINIANDNSDMVVVMFHWGVEYTYNPTENQTRMAHMAIDNGADLVLGNHPHWYQPVEIYKDKIIAYSHGNAIFDQMWADETREGIIGKYLIKGTDVIDIEFVPVFIYNYGQPKILTESDDPIEQDRGKKIVDNLEKISSELIK